MNYKRKKPRRKVRCQICTPHRNGNSRKSSLDQPGSPRRLGKKCAILVERNTGEVLVVAVPPDIAEELHRAEIEIDW